jgi:hypothetical protein
VKSLGEKIVKGLCVFLSLLVVSSIVAVVSAPVTVPLVYVDPAESAVDPGDSFSININVQDVTDLFSWGIRLEFNPNVLECTAVTEGPFIQSQNPTSFVNVIKINYIDAGCTTLGALPGVSGSGVLMTATFTVKDSGTSDLHLNEARTSLLDSTITAIPHDTADGHFHTNAAANLVRKSAWPEHHHYVISKDEDGNQTLYAKVKNLGLVDLHVYVRFDIVRDDALVATVYSAEVVVTPDTIVDLTADFPLMSADVGKYYVSASAGYSWTGYYFTQGDKIKTFSFAVVP